MKVYDAVERSPLAIPFREILNEKGEFDFVPEVRERGYFDIDYRKNELVLVAGKFIGQVPLTPDVTIHVSPKVPIGNLARIIGVANQPLRCLDFFRRKYRLDGSASNSIQEAMAKSLLSSLREMHDEGAYREYLQIEENLRTLRGRIAVPQYVSRSLSRGLATVVQCEYFVLTADTTLNRVVKRAIYELGTALGSQSNADLKIVRELASYFDLLSAVHLDHSPSLVRRAEEWLERRQLPDLRLYYQDILDVCFIVLAGSGVEVIDKEGPRGMHSVLVDLEEAFEEYVRSILGRAALLTDSGVRVLNGNSTGKQPLFSTTDKYEAKPDIVIKRDQACFGIGDAKYKVKLDEKDRYQLISHAVSFGAPRCFLITPATAQQESGPAVVGTIGPTQVYHYRIDLDGNLRTEEDRFVSWVNETLCAT